MGKDAKFYMESSDSTAPIAPAVSPLPSVPKTSNAVHRFGKRIIRQRHNSAQTYRSRLLLKHGSYNITGKNIPQRRVRLVSDLWNTLIDLKWRFILIL